MSTALSAFTNQLLNLIKNLSEMYPSDPDIQFTNTTVNFLKSSNPRKLQKIFEEYVKQYETQIMKKDENFLLNNNFIEDNKDLSHDEKQVDYDETIIDNLRKYWKDMDEESKENIWKYLQVLLILSNKC